MLIYLAQPIDQAGKQTHPIMKALPDLLARLETMGVSCFKPMAAYHLTRSIERVTAQVDQINTHALDTANAVLAVIPMGVPTLGVPVEIERALQLNKPVVIFTDQELLERSVQLQAWAARGCSIWTLPGAVDDWDEQLLRGDLNKHPSVWGGSAVSTAAKPRHTGPAYLGEETTFAGELLEIAEPNLPVMVSAVGHLPRRGHSTDAGVDLALAGAPPESTSSAIIGATYHLRAGEYAMFPTGIRAQIPEGYWGLIIGRSSTWAKHRCDVRLAVIDAGYTGELKIGITNMSKDKVTFYGGDRVAQYVLLPSWGGSVKLVSEFADHSRGDNGYGSTGR